MLLRNKVSVIPVLPNMVTSTDEVTIFATPTKIYNKEQIYLVARPKCMKNEKVDSGKCNDYCTNKIGDADCRGLRLVLNTTFTAGGLSAPIFAVVYGLKPDEMPNSEIVTLAVPGLTVGSERNIYCKKEGYITFVRGKYGDEENHDDDIPETHSKESRIAHLYCELVYCPFIRDLQMSQYGWNGEGPVPDNIEAAGWMDGWGTWSVETYNN